MRAAFRQAELDALQSQINPHFLYNTLECIRGQAIVDGNRPIADMARALSEFFRYSISRATHLVTVEDELRNVSAYMKIQNYRFGEKYQVRISMDESDRPFILQCLLPPADHPAHHPKTPCFMAFTTQTGKGVSGYQPGADDSRLILSVADHGAGMSQKQMDRLNTSMRDGHPPYRRPPESRSAATAASPCRTSTSGSVCCSGRDYGLRCTAPWGWAAPVEIVLPIKRGAGQAHPGMAAAPRS